MHLIGDDQVTQAISVVREAKEVVFLFYHFRTCQVDRAAASTEFSFAIKLLAAHAVEATIGALVDVAALSAGVPELAHAVQMAGVIAGANEIIIREIQQFAEPAKVRGVAVHQRLRWNALALGCPHVLQAVLVRSSQEPHLVSCEPVIACQGVSQNELQGMAEMRPAVDIGKGGSDIPGVVVLCAGNGHGCLLLRMGWDKQQGPPTLGGPEKIARLC